MYFILSKILLFLLFPISWIVAFILIALFSKKARLKKRALMIAAALLVFFSNPFIFYEFAKCWDTSPVSLQNDRIYSAAIVLGGFSGEDKNGQGYFTTSADRFLQGIKLKASGRVSHIMITSGDGSLMPDGFSEGAWAKDQLKQLNIPDSVVLIEQRSRNTIENAMFSKAILTRTNLKPPYLLVTSAFHMRRSLYIFKKEGLDVVPYPCNYYSGNSKLTIDKYLIPDANVLGMWQTYLKEVVGLAFTYLKYNL